MKAVLFSLLVLNWTANTFAQGLLAWGNNFSPFRAPIYDSFDYWNGGITGQSALGNPSGNTVYTGPLLQGSSFTFAVFAGPNGAPSNALVLIGSTTFRTAAGNALPAGIVNTGTTTVLGVPPGGLAEFQIRVWNNYGGTLTTWAQAEAAWLEEVSLAVGVSRIVTTAPLGGTDTNGTFFATPITSGWTSFSLGIPEPSALSLLALVAALYLFTKTKN